MTLRTIKLANAPQHYEPAVVSDYTVGTTSTCQLTSALRQRGHIGCLCTALSSARIPASLAGPAPAPRQQRADCESYIITCSTSRISRMTEPSCASCTAEAAPVEVKHADHQPHRIINRLLPCVPHSRMLPDAYALYHHAATYNKSTTPNGTGGG